MHLLHLQQRRGEEEAPTGYRRDDCSERGNGCCGKGREHGEGAPAELNPPEHACDVETRNEWQSWYVVWHVFECVGSFCDRD